MSRSEQSTLEVGALGSKGQTVYSLITECEYRQSRNLVVSMGKYKKLDDCDTVCVCVCSDVDIIYRMFYDRKSF